MRQLIIIIILSSFFVFSFASGKASDFITLKGPTSAPTGAKGLCSRYSWACSHSGEQNPSGALSFKTMKTLNRNINRKYREISDKSQYGVEEYWALLTKKGGDCEDFALSKKKAFIERGAVPESLLVATVLDRQRNAHAVLVLLTDQGDYVFDNLTSTVKRWNKTGYFFLRIQDPEAPWKWQAVYKLGK